MVVSKNGGVKDEIRTLELAHSNLQGEAGDPRVIHSQWIIRTQSGVAPVADSGHPLKECVHTRKHRYLPLIIV